MFIRLDNVKAQAQGLFNIDNHGLYYLPVGSAWIAGKNSTKRRGAVSIVELDFAVSIAIVFDNVPDISHSESVVWVLLINIPHTVVY